MKKIGFLLAAFILFFFLSPRVLAECTTCSPTQVQQETNQEVENQEMENNLSLGELRRNVIEKRETIRERIQERQATMAARLAEQKRERVRTFFGRLTQRFQAAINRLERLITRMESRLAKIEENDEEIETKEIRENLDEAKDKLAEASAALSEAKTSVEDILNGDNPQEMFQEVRDLLKGIKDELIEVHRILVQVIGEMKGLRVGQGE